MLLFYCFHKDWNSSQILQINQIHNLKWVCSSMENRPDKDSEAVVNTIVRQPLAQGFPLMLLLLQADIGTNSALVQAGAWEPQEILGWWDSPSTVCWLPGECQQFLPSKPAKKGTNLWPSWRLEQNLNEQHSVQDCAESWLKTGDAVILGVGISMSWYVIKAWQRRF